MSTSLEPRPVLWADRILTIIAVIHNTCLFIRIVYQNRQNIQNGTKQKNAIRTRTRLSIYFALISFILLNLSAFCNAWDPQFKFFGIGCNVWYPILAITFYIAKLAIYMYSVNRLKVVFNTSTSLAYNNIFLNVLVVFLIIKTVFLIFMHSTQPTLLLNGECIVNAPGWLFMMGMVLDNIINITLFYLFYRKMRLLAFQLNVSTNLQQSKPERDEDGKNKNKSTNEIENADPELYYVVRKYMLLLLTIILSTWMCVLFYIFPTGSALGAGSIDSMINGWCLVLFDKRYNNMYLKLYGCIAKEPESMRVKREVESQASKSNGSDSSTTDQKSSVNTMQVTIS